MSLRRCLARCLGVICRTVITNGASLSEGTLHGHGRRRGAKSEQDIADMAPQSNSIHMPERLRCRELSVSRALEPRPILL